MLAWLFGGRPMRRQGFAFTDRVSRDAVWYWIDRRGRRWMATGAWSRDRVLATEPPR